MKIAEVISDTNVGGAGILLLNRLECTDLEKYQTYVLVPENSKLIERFEKIGVNVIQVDCEGDNSWSWKDVKKYKKILEAVSLDVINCHGCLSARVASKEIGVPVKICTRHCVFPVKLKDRIWGAVNDRLSDAFVAVAYAAKRNLIDMGIREEKIHVVINGAKPLGLISPREREELRAKLGIRKNTLVLVMCARLERYKGHKCFLRAIRLLVEKGFDCVGLLVGEGSEREALEKYSSELGISDRIRFVGFVCDVSPYVNIADVNVNCSVGTETSSLALSEGMSIGLPAVVSDYGGNPYMVKNMENGLVFSANDPEALARCIKKISSDKKLYSQMSKSARLRFETELNSKSMTEKTLSLYDRLFEAYRTRNQS